MYSQLFVKKVCKAKASFSSQLGHNATENVYSAQPLKLVLSGLYRTCVAVFLMAESTFRPLIF
jgi:hypothetical protein